MPELDFIAHVEVTGDIFTSYLYTRVWLNSENIHVDPFRNSLVFLSTPSTNLLIAQVKAYGMSAIITNWITSWECGQCCSTTCLHEGFYAVEEKHVTGLFSSCPAHMLCAYPWASISMGPTVPEWGQVVYMLTKQPYSAHFFFFFNLWKEDCCIFYVIVYKIIYFVCVLDLCRLVSILRYLFLVLSIHC